MFFDRDFGAGGGPGRRPFPSMDPGSQGRFPGFGARAGFDEFANRHPMFGRNSPFEDRFENVNGFPHRERTNSGNSSNGSGHNGPATTGKEHVIPIKVIHTKSEPSEQSPNMSQSPKPDPEPQQQGNSSPADVPDKGRKQTYSQQRNTSEIPHPKFNESVQRNQRAHSAPPGTETESLGRPSPPPQPKPTAEPPNVTQLGGKTSKSQGQPANGVRNIPIFVEGRKGPAVNGNCHPGNTKQRGPVIEEEKTQQSANESKSSRSTPEESVVPPKKQALPKPPLEQIQEVLDDVQALAKQVELFNGTFKNKDYLYLDEMLTRDLIKLDLIETEGKEEIRLARKNCIREIQNTIAKLETKVTANEEKEKSTDAMEVEEAKTESSSNPESMNANVEAEQNQPVPQEQESDKGTSDVAPMETDPNPNESSTDSTNMSKPGESK